MATNKMTDNTADKMEANTPNTPVAVVGTPDLEKDLRIASEEDGNSQTGTPDTPQDPTSPPADPPEPFSVFTRGQKRWISWLASYGAMFSTLNSQIYFPAVVPISQDLGVSVALVN